MMRYAFIAAIAIASTSALGQTVTDTFTTPSSWQATAGLPGLALGAGSATPASTFADESSAYTATSFGADQYAEVTIGTVSTNAPNSGVGPAVRASAAGEYRATCSTQGWEEYEVNLSGGKQLATGTTPCNAGDKVRLTVIGSQLTLTDNGATLAPAITVSDLATGQPAIAYSSTATPTPSIASFTAGAAGAVPTSLPFTLSWPAVTTATNGTAISGVTYNVYQNGAQVAAGLSSLTYVTPSLPVGAYTWYVTAVAGGVEGAPSPSVSRTVNPPSPATPNAPGTPSVTFTVPQGSTVTVTIP